MRKKPLRKYVELFSGIGKYFHILLSTCRGSLSSRHYTKAVTGNVYD